jgi:hypothetical protein
MCKLLVVGGIYYVAMGCLILFVPQFSRRKNDISETLGENGAGIVGFLLLSVLSLSSLPLGCLLDWLLKRANKSAIIEYWVLFLTLINISILFLALGHWPWFFLFSALTIADSVYAMVYLLVTWQDVRSAARSLLLDVVRYLQVIIAFACIFLSVHELSDKTALCKAGIAIPDLSPGQALYFSAVNATTVGAGDMGPCFPGSPNLTFLLRPTTLIPAEIFCIVLILALDIPRVLAKQQTQRGQQNHG